MPLRFGILLSLMLTTSCAELSPTPEERNVQDVQAVREWERGPMMETCFSLPGPDSRLGCAMVWEGALTILRGDRLTREDQFRIELAKAKGTDEVRRIWSRAEREAWVRGPKTLGCQQAPFPAQVRWCLDGVQADLDALSRPDDIASDPPEVRAERAVARLDAREQERAIDRQHTHELDLARQQAAGQALIGLGLSGGFMKPLPPQPTYPPVPIVPLTPLVQPRPMPPISCTSQQVGQVGYTNCY